MNIIAKRPQYSALYYCMGCDLPNHQCTCEPQDAWSMIDDESLDDPRRGQAEAINRSNRYER